VKYLTKALFSVLTVFPLTCSIFAGFVVIGRQFRGWLVLDYWPTIGLHDVLDWWMGRPISIDRIETELLELVGWPYPTDGMERHWAMLFDAVLRWVLDSVPLALWLILVLPIFWFLTWICIFDLLGRPQRTPGSGTRRIVISWL
jgi:hypothetical protein